MPPLWRGAFSRQALANWLTNEFGLKIVGAGESAEDVVELALRHAPNIRRAELDHEHPPKQKPPSTHS